MKISAPTGRLRGYAGHGRFTMAMAATYGGLSSSEHSAQLRKDVIASTIGTTIEWYDFFIYGTAAGLVRDFPFRLRDCDLHRGLRRREPGFNSADARLHGPGYLNRVRRLKPRSSLIAHGRDK